HRRGGPAGLAGARIRPVRRSPPHSVRRVYRTYRRVYLAQTQRASSSRARASRGPGRVKGEGMGIRRVRGPVMVTAAFLAFALLPAAAGASTASTAPPVKGAQRFPGGWAVPVSTKGPSWYDLAYF